MRRRGSPKPKRVSYELISRDSIIGTPMYLELAELIGAYHEDLRDARIALAWCTAWKPDVDGRCRLGQCKKASDLDRELAAWDFVLLLRRQFWMSNEVTNLQRRALLDHELMHAARKHDATGEPATDERGRPVFRTRRHDVEEFQAVVERHGCYKRDLEAFAAALLRAGAPAFTACASCQDSPGWVYVTDDVGVKRVARYPCWLAWQAQIEDRRSLSA